MSAVSPSPPLPTKDCGTHAVTFLHQPVKSSQAGKTARHGHLDDRQTRVGEQPLGKKQPVGLCETDRGNPEFSLEDAPQVTICHPQPIGQSGDAESIQKAVFDQARGAVGKAGVCLDARIAWRKLRTAPEAWPETGRFGRRSAREKGATLTSSAFSRGRRVGSICRSWKLL